MTKRSAYGAEIDDADVVAPKRSKVDVMVTTSSRRILTWPDIYKGLRKFFQARLPQVYIPGDALLVWTMFLDYFKIHITWTPAFHIVRRKEECHSIFTLLVLHHYDKIPVTFDCLDVIIKWFVVASNRWTLCDTCRGYLMTHCVNCKSVSALFIDCADIVKFM